MLYVVNRPFNGVVRHMIGEVVDAGTWRHRHLLEAQRNISPAPADVVPIACECGRKWASQAYYANHQKECPVALDKKHAVASEGPRKKASA